MTFRGIGLGLGLYETEEWLFWTILVCLYNPNR